VPDDRFELEVLPLTTWLFDKSFTSDCSAEMMPPCPYCAATVLVVAAGAVLVPVVPLAGVLVAAIVLPAALIFAAAALGLSPPPPPPRSCRPVWRKAWNRSPRKDCRSCTTFVPFALLLEFVAAAVVVLAAVAAVPAVPAADDDDCAAACVRDCSRLANKAAPGCCALLLEEPWLPPTACDEFRDDSLSGPRAGRKLTWLAAE
jgi:hypothetical protein